MKFALFGLLFLPFSSRADIVESIEKFTDIFSISFSNSHGTTITTLEGSYDLTDTFRVFGDIDTESYWEVGVGYSFWQGESYYTENTLSASNHRYSTGIFGAKVLNEQWALIGDINYNYKLDIKDPFCKPANVCLGDHLNYSPSDSIDYSLGTMWSPFQYVDLIYKINHEVGLQTNTLTFFKDVNWSLERTNTYYHETAIYFNLPYIRPSVTYTHFDKNDNYIEFGLTFDF